MRPLSSNERLATSRKQTLLAVLVAVAVVLAWYNSSLIKGELDSRRARRGRENRAPTPPPMEPAGPRLPDHVTVLKDGVRLDPTTPHQFAFSPNTNAIAYFDHDTLWCQYLPNGPPTKLDEISNRRSLQTAALHWSNASNRVFYAFSSMSSNSQFTDTYVASWRQRGTKLTRIDWETIEPRYGTNTLRLSEDSRHVVGLGLQPFLWNVAERHWVVCCFDVLVPSATSDRWLGVEIDTHQLVIVDRNFQIIRRVDYVLTNPEAIHLSWSPDERYASMTPHRHSGQMQSLRVNLQSGKAEPIAVDHGSSPLEFTGNGGEIFHVSAVSQSGQRTMTTIPTGNAKPRFNFEYTHTRRSSVVPSPDFRHVALTGVFPAEWQIVDETGTAWPLPKEDGLLASYVVLGFANNGQTIVAYGDERIVTMPLTCLLEEEEEDVTRAH